MTDKSLELRRPESFALTPAEVVENATTQARLLMDIVEQTKCYQIIGDKKYLQVEAWETIGAFNRAHSQTAAVTPILKEGEVIGYQAHVELWKDGEKVGGAIMPCYFTEPACRGKEGDAKHKSCMSAAQTFATSKAYRMNFAYVAILAGYQPMPAEEVTPDMAVKERRTVDKSEHFCEIHGVNFFKRGKMTAFAHPIGDTGKWCQEKASPKEAGDSKSPTQADTPEILHPTSISNGEELPNGIQMDKLRQMLTECQWSPADVGAFIKRRYGVTGKKQIENLSREQAEDFMQEVQERLAKREEGV